MSCLQLSFTTRHIFPASFHHPFSRMEGLLNLIHRERPEALPSTVSALRDDRVKGRQEVNLPETTFHLQLV